MDQPETNWTVVEPGLFYSLLVSYLYPVVDLRSAENYAKACLATAQSSPPGTCSWTDEFGADLKDTVLVYNQDGNVTGEQRKVINLIRQDTRVKRIYLLQHGFQNFKDHYPFLVGTSKGPAGCYPAEILPYLYLGGSMSSSDPLVLQDLKVTYANSLYIDR